MSGMRTLMGRLRGLVGRFHRDVRREFLRDRLFSAAPGSLVRLPGMELRVTDGPNAYMQYKDEFVRRNYAFDTTRPNPIVIDGGANMGMFTLATLRDHPGARIIAFEPDPAVFVLLRENLERHGARHVTLVNAALGAAPGTMAFVPDGQAGGMLTSGGGAFQVRVETLSEFLTEDIDFLKLNIEGAELDVLREAAGSGRLARVRAMVIEYHGWPRGEQRLGPLLALLDDQGFRYFVHDQDGESNPATKPPFRDPADVPWFALVYAYRASGHAS